MQRLFGFSFLLLLPFFSLSLFLSATIQYSVESQTTCQCDFATFSLLAENTGDEKAYDELSISDLAYPKTISVSLEPGEKKTFSFYTQSCDVGEHTITVKGKKTLSPTLFVKPCEGFSLAVTPQQAVCQGQPATFRVDLTNDGRATENVSLTTNLNTAAYMLQKNVVLAPFEKKSVFLIVNTPTFPQRLPFNVKASSASEEEEQNAIVSVEDCEGLLLEGPDKTDVIVNQTSVATLYVKNIGKTRRVSLEAFCPAFVKHQNQTLTLNSSQKVPYPLEIRADAQGKTSCALFAKPEGETRSYTKTLSINAEATAPLLSAKPTNFEVELGVETTIVFTIKNFGAKGQVKASIRTANATTLTPQQTIPLDKNEEKNVSFIVKGNQLGLTKATLLLNEAQHAFNLNIRNASLLMQATTYRTPQGLRVDYVFTNLGDGISLRFSASPQAQGPTRLDLQAQSQGFASFTTNTTEPFLVLSVQTTRGNYTHAQPLSSPKPLPQTGLVTYATPVLTFAVAIILALLILYFIFRRSREKQRN